MTGAPAPAAAQVDHLVVLATDLAQGVAWCEATLGVTPGPGGAHPLMGTHNRLLRIGGASFARAYLEIVAIDPQARPTREPPARRWFDMDDPALQARVRAQGPQLAHFVASVPDVRSAVAALEAQGIDRGRVIEASRMTARGPLQWQITVRDDGQRLFDGALPTLIRWGAEARDSHPGCSLPDSGLALLTLGVTHPEVGTLQRAYDAIGLQQVALRQGPPGLCATFSTSIGEVRLAADRGPPAR